PGARELGGEVLAGHGVVVGHARPGREEAPHDLLRRRALAGAGRLDVVARLDRGPGGLRVPVHGSRPGNGSAAAERHGRRQGQCCRAGRPPGPAHDRSSATSVGWAAAGGAGSAAAAEARARVPVLVTTAVSGYASASGGSPSGLSSSGTS